MARARVSLRLAPGDDAVAATSTLMAFLRDAAPWGVEVTVEGGAFDAGQGYMVDTVGAGAAAPPRGPARRRTAPTSWRPAPADRSRSSRCSTETFPGIAVLMLGASDERSNTHSVNESVDLGELEHMALAEALFLRKLAEHA